MESFLLIIERLKDTPVPILLIGSGILFLFMAIAQQFKDWVSLPTRGRQILAGILGVIFIGFGLGVYMFFPYGGEQQPQSSTQESSSLSPSPTSTPCSTISGVVKDEKTDEPIQGAVVTLDVAPLSLIEGHTYSGGKFSLALPAEEHSPQGILEVEAPGFEQNTAQVVDVVHDCEITVSLARREAELAETPISIATMKPTTVTPLWTSTPLTRTPVATVTPKPTVMPADIGFAQLEKWRDMSVNTTVYDAAFSPDGKWLAVALRSGKVYIWSTTTWEKQEIPFKKPVRAVSFGIREGKLVLATGSDDGLVRFWQFKNEVVQADEAMTPLLGNSERWPIYSVAFSPNGKFLVLGSWKNIRIWDLETEEIKGEAFRDYNWPVFRVAFSPEGEMIASAGWDGNVRLWRLDGTLVSKWEVSSRMSYSVAFSPQGSIMAVGTSGDDVSLWNVTNPLSPESFGDLRGHDGDVFSVVFSPNGKLIASGGWDKTVRLWDVSSGHSIVEGAFAGKVRTVAFSPDGKMLVSGTESGEITLWRMPRP